MAGADLTAEIGWLDLDDGAGLRVGLWTATATQRVRGTVLLLQGLGEFLERYQPIAAALGESGFHTLSFDWRGQGLSTRRLTGSRHQRAHVADFTAPARDLGAIRATIAGRGLPEPIVMIGHSMGAAIGLLHLIDHPDAVACAVATAPMIEIVTRPYPVWVARLVARVAVGAGFAGAYAFGQGDYDPAVQGAFDGNPMTSDRERFAAFHRVYQTQPRYIVAGATFGFVDAAFRLTDRLMAPGAPERLTIPCLIVSAPDDRLVSAVAQRAFADRLPNGRLVTVAGCRHEPLQERPELRDQVWREVTRVVDETIPAR